MSKIKDLVMNKVTEIMDNDFIVEYTFHGCEYESTVLALASKANVLNEIEEIIASWYYDGDNISLDTFADDLEYYFYCTPTEDFETFSECLKYIWSCILV